MQEEYEELARRFTGQGDNAETFFSSPFAPQRYSKVLQAYRARKNSAEPKRRISALMRIRTLEELEKHGITRYRLCKDLHLNAGNVYAYLSKGDTSKVSLATARRIMEYAMGSSNKE